MADTPSPINSSLSLPEHSLLKLAREAVEVAAAGDIRRGLSLALTARQQARDSADSTAELAALSAIARCHNMRHDSIASLSIGIDTAALARAQGDSKAWAHALCTIAFSTFSLHLLDEALVIAERAIADAKVLNDDDLESRARQTYGLVLGDLQRFAEAREQLTLAVQAARRLNTPGSAAFQHRINANLVSLSRKEARHYQLTGDTVRMKVATSAALDGAKAIIAIAHQQNNVSLTINMHALIGEILGLQDNIPEAISTTELAISLAIKHKQMSSTVPTRLRLATFFQMRHNPVAARQTLLDGIQVAESFRPTFRIGQYADALAQNALEQGSAGEASVWSKRATEEKLSFEHEREKARVYLRQLHAEILAS